MGQTVLYDLSAPLKGEILPLSAVEDEAFASGLLGKGLAILPTDGKVFAPADGVVSTLFLQIMQSVSPQMRALRF